MKILFLNLSFAPMIPKTMKSWVFIKKMKVGDAFACTEHQANKAQASSYYYGIKLTRRKQVDGTFRVWRIA